MKVLFIGGLILEITMGSSQDQAVEFQSVHRDGCGVVAAVRFALIKIGRILSLVDRQDDGLIFGVDL